MICKFPPIIASFHLTKLLNTSSSVLLKRKESMDHSEFEICKKSLLPNCWVVVRIDGKGFHKFTDNHNFKKPNDLTALNLMNRCAVKVINEFEDMSIAYGQSDEYSFIFNKQSKIYKRKTSELMTQICSLFSSSYVYFWTEYFPEKSLQYPPAFDARIVQYASIENIRDYLTWRQVDCHINNLYNTTFWALVLKGRLTPQEAEEKLRGTLAGDKHEILFSKFNINYNNEPQVYRKGTVLFRKRILHNENSAKCEELRTFQDISTQNVDIIKDNFWKENSHLLQ